LRIDLHHVQHRVLVLQRLVRVRAGALPDVRGNVHGHLYRRQQLRHLRDSLRHGERLQLLPRRLHVSQRQVRDTELRMQWFVLLHGHHQDLLLSVEA
jgi:hypothetical protein